MLFEDEANKHMTSGTDKSGEMSAFRVQFSIPADQRPSMTLITVLVRVIAGRRAKTRIKISLGEVGLRWSLMWWMGLISLVYWTVRSKKQYGSSEISAREILSRSILAGRKLGTVDDQRLTAQDRG